MTYQVQIEFNGDWVTYAAGLTHDEALAYEAHAKDHGDKARIRAEVETPTCSECGHALHPSKFSPNFCAWFVCKNVDCDDSSGAVQS